VLAILFRQSALYAATSVVVRAVNFLVLPVYARVFSPGEFGVYELITVFTGFVGLIVALEITQGVARYFPDAATEREKIEYASSSLWFTLGVYMLFCAAAAAAAQPVTRWLVGSESYAATFQIAMLAMWANGVCYALQNQLRWQLFARYYAASTIVVTVVSQGVAVTLILSLHAGLAGIFWGSFFGSLTGSIVAAYYARESLAMRFSWTKVATMLRFSAPLAAAGLAVFAARYVDRIAIKELLDVHSVGIYAIAARLSALASILLVGFQGALIPIITAFHREARAPDDLARVFRYFLACAMPLTLLIGVYSREIMVVLAGSAYEQGHVLIPWLAVGTILSGMYVFMPGLWLAKQTLHSLAINAFSAVLAIVLCFVLIPAAGVAGAALAMVGAAAANFLAVFVMSQRRYPLPIASGRILASLGLFAILLVIGAASARSEIAGPALRGIYAALAMLSIALALVSPAEARRLVAGAWRELRPR
jgi:O-antigen/teichoic acid export membrane protein